MQSVAELTTNIYSILEKIARREIEKDPVAFIRENSFIQEDNDPKVATSIREEDLIDDDYEELKIDNCPLVNGGTAEDGTVTKYFSNKVQMQGHG